MARYRQWLQEQTRPDLCRLRSDAAMVGPRPRRLLAKHLGLFRPAIADAAPRRAGATQDAGRGLVSGRAGQLRAPGAAACRGGARRGHAGDRQQRRGRRAEGDELARVAAQGRRARDPPEGARRALRRSRRRLPSQHPRDHHRLSRHREHRRDLERLRARHGGARGDRPLQADRAESADRLRRRDLCRAKARPARGGRRVAPIAADRRACDPAQRHGRARAGLRRALSTILSATGAEIDAFEPDWLPFDHPLWIVYSSGTTGLAEADRARAWRRHRSWRCR